MTCSLQTYRARIGLFQPKLLMKRSVSRAPGTSFRMAANISRKCGFIILLLAFNLLLKSNTNLQCIGRAHLQNPGYRFKSSKMGYPTPSLGTNTIFPDKPQCMNYNVSFLTNRLVSCPCRSDVTDLPGTIGTTGAAIFPWMDRTQQNKLAHMTSGNRGKRGKGIKCIYWNKGPSFLTNKQLDIETIISSHKPHILGLGEANFRHDHDLQDVQLKDYLLHLDSSINNPQLGMARVAVYTHNSLRVKRRSDLEDSTVAAVWLECGLPNQRSILMCVGYRQWRLLGQQDSTSASTTEQLARWLIFLEKWENALQENKEVIVTLDANLDFLTWRKEGLPSHHSSVRLKSLIDALFEQILPLGVTQLVTGATRFERGQPQAGLDHLYSNKPEKLSSVQTYYTGMSDHKLIKFTRFSKSFKQNPRFVTKRCFKKFDDQQFRQDLAESHLDEILSCTNPNEAAELLVSKLNCLLDKVAPVRTIQTHSNYAPWLGDGTKNLQQERNRAQEKAAKSDDPDDWRAYRSLRNQVTARSRAEEKEWQRQKLDHTKNSSTEMWKRVKGWLGWGGGGPPTQLFSDGKIISSPAGLGSVMNKFFIDKIRRLRSTIPIVISDPLARMKEAMRNRQCSFKLKPVNEADVLKIIGSLKNSSATGVDHIDTSTVKLAADLLAPALTHIINLSILTSTFPDIWKFAKVIPLLKSLSCDPLLPKSYRPVALLPILSKVMEKAVFSQLVSYLEENNLVHPNLHGSRAGHNTSTALIQLYDKWVEEVEDGKMVGVLLCDQSAAFDLCDHYLLVEKLKLLGLDDSAATWMFSYLSGRQQSCYADGHLSTPISLFPCGVPQGSIGGPLLWLCFTCDQPDVIHDHPVDGQDLHRGCGPGSSRGEEGTAQDREQSIEENAVIQRVEEDGGCGDMVGYVDDGAYSYAHKDPAVLSRVLTRKYGMLEEWMNGNKLVVNPDKTHVLVMGTQCMAANRRKVSMQAGQFTIKPTVTEKLLGGHIHQSLKWNHHLSDHESSMMNQLTSRINGLKKISANATFNTRLMVANGVVMSKLVYLITVWGGAQQYLLKRLQVQQLTAARAVCGFTSFFWSKKKLLDRVNWLSIRQLIFFHTVLQAHKTIQTGIPRVIHESISTNYPYRTRSASSGLIRFGETFKGQSNLANLSFKHRAVQLYNTVPVSVRTGSLATVKGKLKKWVKQNVPIDWG